MRTLIFLCFVGCAITWPILLPINATGGGTSKQLDRLSIGNVTDPNKLYAHAIVAWLFFGFVMFTISRERLWLIGLRQAWNLSDKHSKKLSSRVVLFLGAPTSSLEQENMKRYFGEEAVRVWPATDAKKLKAMVSKRNEMVEKLESAQLTLIQNARSWNKKDGARGGGSSSSYDGLPTDLKRALRPTHRIKNGPAKKVDSINWYRDQIKEIDQEIAKTRDSNANINTDQSHGGGAAVFVEFRSQAAAQQAFQQVTTSEILALQPRYRNVKPTEVIWDNLSLPPARRITQAGIASGLVIAIIVFW
jgi:calcium permeable stress-gated cation channel